MEVKHARLTLQRIAERLEADQGATFRRHLGLLVPRAADAFRGDEDPFRTHLGCSMLGRDCARELWYGFHWAKKPKHEGRILRLFNRGHLEEPRFVALLLTIGCEVWQFDEAGNQYRVSDHEGHLGGSLDAIVKGLPEAPDEPMLAEFKTHGDKSFQKLVGEGVRQAKFEHYVQMNMYMGKMGLRYALYLAVNKNDDDLYGEIIAFDAKIYEQFLERARMVIASELPPPRINESPGWYKCKFCDYRGICHSTDLPEENCRTCTFSKPDMGGAWFCAHHNMHLSKGMQMAGCGDYLPLLEMKGR